MGWSARSSTPRPHLGGSHGSGPGKAERGAPPAGHGLLVWLTAGVGRLPGRRAWSDAMHGAEPGRPCAALPCPVWPRPSRPAAALLPRRMPVAPRATAPHPRMEPADDRCPCRPFAAPESRRQKPRGLCRRPCRCLPRSALLACRNHAFRTPTSRAVPVDNRRIAGLRGSACGSRWDDAACVGVWRARWMSALVVRSGGGVRGSAPGWAWSVAGVLWGRGRAVRPGGGPAGRRRLWLRPGGGGRLSRSESRCRLSGSA